MTLYQAVLRALLKLVYIWGIVSKVSDMAHGPLVFGDEMSMCMKNWTRQSFICLHPRLKPIY